MGRTPFYALSVNCLYRVSVRDRVRVRACRPDSSGNLLTGHKMEFTPCYVQEADTIPTNAVPTDTVPTDDRGRS